MRHRLKLRQILSEKWKEALQAVLPIITIVLALSFTIAPLSPSVLLCFLMGAVLILVGMMFFTTGAETAMTPMGERIGTAMTKTKKLGVVITLSFLLGFIITVSEPDLQVLASQVPSVPNLILILSVACGVGVFLVVSLLRMLFSIAREEQPRGRRCLSDATPSCFFWRSLSRRNFSPSRSIPAA